MQRHVHGRQQHWANCIVLRGVDPNDVDEMKEQCTILGVTAVAAKSRLRTYIGSLQVTAVCCCAARIQNKTFQAYKHPPFMWW
jgi:butyrate kinase